MILKDKSAPASAGQLALVVLIALVIGLSGLLTVPPLDRDESRFIQATTQMLETGDFVTIKYQDTERNKKPVGIYWLQAASVQLLADVEDRPLWAYRLPSLLGVVLAAVFTYIAGATLFGPRAGFLAAILLAAAPVVAGEGSIAKTDAVLLATVAGAQAAFVRLLAYAGPRPPLRRVLAFWSAIGAGVLIKGPIAPMILLLTAGGVAFWAARSGTRIDWAQRLRPVTGLAVLGLLVVPWLVAVGIATEGRFFAQSLGTDMLGKVTQGQERHGGPFGYHFLVLWLMFWPAALFLPRAMRAMAPRLGEPAVAFCLAWALPSWLVFELASTKLPHYAMVLYPALALLIGASLRERQEQRFVGLRFLGVAIYLAVAVGLAGGAVYLAHEYSTAGIGPWHYGGAALILICALFAAVSYARRREIVALSAAVLASGVFAWGLFEGILPTLDRLLLTPRLARMLDDHEAHPLRDNKPPVALVGYHEPSAVFLLGTPTALLGPERAALWLGEAPGRVAVVEARKEAAFLAALPAGMKVRRVASLEGFNYSNNRDVVLTLFRPE